MSYSGQLGGSRFQYRLPHCLHHHHHHQQKPLSIIEWDSMIALPFLMALKSYSTQILFCCNCSLLWDRLPNGFLLFLLCFCSKSSSKTSKVCLTVSFFQSFQAFQNVTLNHWHQTEVFRHWKQESISTDKRRKESIIISKLIYENVCFQHQRVKSEI